MDAISRRDFLKASGSLLVSVSLPGAALSQSVATAGKLGGKPPLLPDELDSWIAILPDGSVTAYFGKMDMGQGVDVAIAQIVAEELDQRPAPVRIARVRARARGGGHPGERAVLRPARCSRPRP